MTCSIAGCARPVRARAWCAAHYGRWARWGDPLAAGSRRRYTPFERVMRRVEIDADSGCWECSLGMSNGYAYVNVGSLAAPRLVLAHRYVYEIVMGSSIAAGLELHHRCQVRACVNPDHLEPLTVAEHLAEHATDRDETTGRWLSPWAATR